MLPPGIEALMMITGICTQEEYYSLYAMAYYYEEKDLEGIFHYPIERSDLTEDRFGDFLDAYHDAGCRKIFLEVCGQAFASYGMVFRNIKYDTTLNVMLGEYFYADGDRNIGTISIDFRDGKDKGSDEKQLKIGIGTVNGVIADAKVLLKNTDDKTDKTDNLEDVDKLIDSLNICRDSFLYIVDSAAFTEKSLDKAKRYGINLMTRVPDHVAMAASLMKTPLPDDTMTISMTNADGKETVYGLLETQKEYKGHLCKLAVVYSYGLEETRKKSVMKKVDLEWEETEKSLKRFAGRTYKSLAEADIEKAGIMKKTAEKLNYHKLDLTVTKVMKGMHEKADAKSENDEVWAYRPDYAITVDSDAIEEEIRRECTFVLCSNNPALSGETLLREYKTQSEMGKRLQVLGFPIYMSTLFINEPKRVEALVYLLLISVMLLTLTEKTVQSEMKKNKDTIVGTGGKKQVQPSIDMIIKLMDRIRTMSYQSDGRMVRKIIKMDESALKILNYLKIPESVFAWEA